MRQNQEAVDYSKTKKKIYAIFYCTGKNKGKQNAPSCTY